VIGARDLGKDLELAGGIHRLAARGSPPSADAEVVILHWRDKF